MTRQKMADQNVRKLSRIGKSSLGVTLPVEEIRNLNWREGRKLNVKRIPGGFTIKDARR